MATRGSRRTPSAEALQRVLEVTRQLARPFELDALLALVAEAAIGILDAERATVFLYESATHTLVSKVATGTGELRIPADRGFAGECVKTRDVVVVPDAYADPRFNRDVDRATGFTTRGLITIPMIGYDETLVGVLQVLNKRRGAFGDDDRDVATALAAACAVAIQRAKMLEDIVSKERMERELAVAREIQMGVLPREMPRPAGYDIAGWSRPADQTGGDIFDVIPAGTRVALLIGDATGHGVGPALSVTQVRAMLRMAMRLGAGLDETFRHINDQLSDDLSANRFVTAFLGVLDIEEHRIAYHAGGQGPLLHFCAATGETRVYGSTTLPLGVMPVLRVKPALEMTLGPGDVLALITDGVFEYEGPPGEMFGEDRVAAILRASAAAPASEILRRIVDEVTAFAGGSPQNDDMTLLVVKRTGEG